MAWRIDGQTCLLEPVKCAAQELSIYGRLRKVSRCGPVLMFRHLLVMWRDQYDATTIAQRVKVRACVSSVAIMTCARPVKRRPRLQRSCA